MKKIGLIGGMSYQSTLHYYQGINDGVNARLGGLHSAEIILYNVNFQKFKAWMDENNWDRIGEELSNIACILIRAGADCIAIATNTMHKAADTVEQRINDYIRFNCCGTTSIPLIHIGDAVAKKCAKAGIKTVGLLGTKFTLTEMFIQKKITMRNIAVVAPVSSKVIAEIDKIIFDELCKGVVNVTSKRYLVREIDKMCKSGAEGIILGCTELQMLLTPDSLWNEIDGIEVPLFDTTQAHIDALVDFCLSDAKEIEYGPALHQGFYNPP